MDTSTLTREADAARTLVLNLKDVIADDEALLVDMIEAETGLFEAIDGALNRIDEIDALTDAISAQIDKLDTRKARLQTQAERIRTSLGLALEMAGLKKIERPRATLSMRVVAPSVTIFSEADIPSDFWKPQPPKLDKKAILAALKDKRDVPGASLSNGGSTVSIRKG